MPARRRVTAVPSAIRIFVSCLVAVNLLSCNEEQATVPVNEPGTTAITGRVTVAGQPEVGGVTVWKAGLRPERIETETNVAGGYVVHVPGGDYLVTVNLRILRIWAYHPDGLVRSLSGADTVAVREGTTVTGIDFVLGSLSGEIVPAGGSPGSLSFTMIRLQDGEEYGIQGVQRLEDGRWSFADALLPPGRYVLRVDVSGTCVAVYLPGVPLPEEADVIEVAADAPTFFRGRLNLSTSFLRGRLAGNWRGLGDDRIQIAAFDLDSVQVGFGQVAADGTYGIEITQAVAARIRIESGCDVRWIGGSAFEQARTFALVPGDTTEIDPWTAGNIRVRMSLEDEWRGFQTRVRLVGESGAVVTCHTASRELDQFGVGLLEPGRYRMWVGPSRPGMEPWLPQWFDGGTNPGDATPIEIGPGGEEASLVVHLRRGGRIEGRLVADATGEASTAGGNIVVSPASEKTLWGCVQRSGDYTGLFSVQGLPDGEWKVGREVGNQAYECDPQLRAVIWAPGTSDWNAAQTVRIEGAGVVRNLEIRVP